MKSVFYWSPYLTNVGSVYAVIESAISLKKFSKNFEPYIIDSCGEFENFKKYLNENQIKVINLHKFRYFKILPQTGFLQSRISFIIIFLISFFPLLMLLKRKKPEYMMVYLLTSLPLFLNYVFNLNTRMILRISGFPKMTFLRLNFWKKVLNKIYLVVCPTISTKNDLSELNITESVKIKTLYDPVVDIKKIVKLKKQDIDIKYKEIKFILAIGRLTKQKNFEFLINCFKDISEKYKELNLLIIGDGEDKKKLEKISKTFNIDKKVHLIGFQKNYFKFLSKCECFVLSSLWENPGFVLIDAAASNTTILSSNCKNGPAEILEEDKGGYLFENNNKKSFLQKFDIFMNADKKSIYNKKIFSKKKSHLFTRLNHYKNLNKLIL